MASNADILASLLEADFPDSFTNETDCSVDQNAPGISESPKNEVKTARKLSYDVDLFSKADEDEKVATHTNEPSAIHTYLTDSSDDEDNKYFEESKYNSFGRDIKKQMKDVELSKTEKLYAMLAEASSDKKKQASQNVGEKRNPNQLALAEKPIQKSNDAFADPIFGIRMINPLISSRGLTMRMEGKSAVKLSNLKSYLSCNSAESGDFVIAGALVRAVTKLSRNGDQFMIWEISDLKDDLITVPIFLFGPTYSALWKTSIGTVLGILNPRQGKSENTNFSITLNNADQVMIWGTSKDYGICRALKKSGERCSSFVNRSVCEYCIYHVKKEYKKFSITRSELQSPTCGQMRNVSLRNKVLGKNEVFYGGRSFTSVKPPSAPKVTKKDQNRLTNLGITVLENNSGPRQSTPVFTQQTRGREMMNRLASAPKEIKTVLMRARSQSIAPKAAESSTPNNLYRAKMVKTTLKSSKTDHSPFEDLSSKSQPLSPNQSDNTLSSSSAKQSLFTSAKVGINQSEIENAEPPTSKSGLKSSKTKSANGSSGKYVNDSLSISSQSPVSKKESKSSKAKLKMDNQSNKSDIASPKLKKKSLAIEVDIPELFSSFDSVSSGKGMKSKPNSNSDSNTFLVGHSSDKNSEYEPKETRNSGSSKPDRVASSKDISSSKSKPSNPDKNDSLSKFPKPVSCSSSEESFSPSNVGKSPKLLGNPGKSPKPSVSSKTASLSNPEDSFSVDHVGKSSKSNCSSKPVSLSNSEDFVSLSYPEKSSNPSGSSKPVSLSTPEGLVSVSNPGKSPKPVSLSNPEGLFSLSNPGKSPKPVSLSNPEGLFSLSNPGKSPKPSNSSKFVSLSNPEASPTLGDPGKSPKPSRPTKPISLSNPEMFNSLDDNKHNFQSKPSLSSFDKPFTLSDPRSSSDILINVDGIGKQSTDPKNKSGSSISDINRTPKSHRSSSSKKSKSKCKETPFPAPAKSRFDNLVKMDVSSEQRKKVEIEKTVLSSRILSQEPQKKIVPSMSTPSNNKVESVCSPKLENVAREVKPQVPVRSDEIKKPPSSDFSDNPRVAVLANRTIPPSPHVKKMSMAKMRAIEIVKQKGVAPQSSTTRTKLLQEALTQKRKREDEPEETDKPVFSELFMELMKKGTKHIELVDMELMRKEEEYFERMGMKEALEEKMLNTFKVDCKAVKCLKCKYTWFSSSDICKAQRHPLKVVDAVKRFFQCKDCGNRTIALTVFPLISCRQCEGSNWVRAAMIREKVYKNNEGLSIRGGEQQFFNGAVTNANLNLLVPE